MPLVDLTHPLRAGSQHFPGSPELAFWPHRTIDRDQYATTAISMGSHQGTHLDSMSHFLADGRTVDHIPLEWLHGPAHLLRIPRGPSECIALEDILGHEHQLQPEGKVVIETGWHRQYGTAAYFTHSPWLTIQTIEYLVRCGIRMLGLDIPTPSRCWSDAHQILLKAEVVIVESLANLHLLPDRFTITALPLPFVGLDGSPVRAIAEF